MFKVLHAHFVRLLMIVGLLLSMTATAAHAQSTAFRQAVADAASRDEELAAFYRGRDFQGIWSGAGDQRRRNALMSAFADAPMHGLPAARYDADALMAKMRAASPSSRSTISGISSAWRSTPFPDMASFMRS